MSDASSITKLKNNSAFKLVVNKLLLDKELTKRESTFLLSAAIALLRYGLKDKNRTRSLEFAYWIILNYSLSTGDYRPLYDLSFELGLYPLAKSIVDLDERRFDTLKDYIALAEIKENFTKGVTLTLEQKLSDRSFFSYSGEGFAYIAPTSFGKTERLVKAVLDDKSGSRPCVIVPTKSLLAQTRDDVFKHHPRAKVITHDEMYQSEQAFIAILTQERAIRLLEANQTLSFSSVFIDEAHNAFDVDDRALLISRLIRESKLRNPSTKFYYFSPVINDINLLSAISGFEVEGCKISKSMKEPRYYLLDNGGALHEYNRFFNSFCEVSSFNGTWDCLKNRATAKNLVFLSSPRKVREAALDLANSLPDDPVAPELARVIYALTEHVSPLYDEILCLRHGVVYLHGQMPDGIKNYLLDRAAKLDSIRYIIANEVIMEGINLPFDSVFILELRTKRRSALINLIGRASRLNYVFCDRPHLKRLSPQVIFAESKWTRSRPTMTNAIAELHGVGFKDRGDNLRIRKSKGESLSDKESKRLDFEDSLIQSYNRPNDDLEILLDRSGLRSMYENWEDAKVEIVKRLNTLETAPGNSVLELICSYFIDNGFVFSDSYLRVRNLRKQLPFYQSYLENKSTKSLSQRLAADIPFWKKKAETTHDYLYVGHSFGEINFQGLVDGKCSYVDISQKNDAELPALFLAKYKTEDDYLGFTLSKFVRVLYKTGHIDPEQYYMFLYGTSDKESVELIQAGVPLSLINILKENNLLNEICFDQYGNISIGVGLRRFSNKVDDYTRFEIDQFNIE
ncbi:MAG: DEAD/DEAH box helicase [Collinsella sp.]|nr:DEAD/DEAH box helicase [Collinsella sp.]